jgi:hypothetical protein
MRDNNQRDFNNLRETSRSRASLARALQYRSASTGSKLFKPTHSLSNIWRIIMKIENLSKDLDAKALSAVHGGNDGNSAVNTIGQVTNLTVPVGVLSGGPSNTNVSVDSTQRAKIWNEQFSGDSYIAGLPYCF